MTSGIEIITVIEGGFAELAGILPGDVLLEVNGEAVLDSLNYQFLVSQRDFTSITIKKNNGELLKAELDNGGGALGLVLAEDKIKTCRQNCVFCFVQQMPTGFRKSLYLKDEDIRLSFLHGQFTTLSNSDDTELDRIIRERLSPIHVSVHATEPSARVRMMGNPTEGDILRKIDRLIEGGIAMHTQVVIAPGYNDGKIWERTLADLWKRRAFSIGNRNSGILSLSCVPVGLTAHRQNLPLIQEIDREYAANWIKKWKPEIPRCASVLEGEPWLMLADEWFARADMKFPRRKYYSATWNQIENGIGLIRRFIEHSRRFVKSGRVVSFANKKLLLLTGASFAPYLIEATESLNHRVESMMRVVAVPNEVFGESVTVAGLLCGQDLLKTAKKHLENEKGTRVDAVVIPGASVRAIASPAPHASPLTYQFLDDMTTAELQSQLGLPVIPSGSNFSELLSNINKDHL